MEASADFKMSTFIEKRYAAYCLLEIHMHSFDQNILSFINFETFAFLTFLVHLSVTHKTLIDSFNKKIIDYLY